MKKKETPATLKDTMLQYSQSHSISDVFSSSNKVIVFGKAETNLKLHHTINTKQYKEQFFSVILEIQRTPDVVDHIPVIIPETLVRKAKLPSNVKDIWLEVSGQLRTYDLIIDGSRKLPLVVFAKLISFFKKKSCIEKRLGKNVIFLAGTIAEYPILHFTDHTELILSVHGPGEKNYLIPCFLHKNNPRYEDIAHKFQYGMHLEFYGRIQNKLRSPYYYPAFSMQDYNTAYEISILEI